MFTTRIKRETKISIQNNAKERYLPGILFVIIPFIIYHFIQSYLQAFIGETLTFIVDIVLLIIIQYLGVWLSIFGMKVIKEKTSIKNTIPSLELLKKIIIPIIILAVFISVNTSYGYTINIFLKGIIQMLTVIISIYILLLMVSYIVEDGNINQKKVFKVLPEFLWRYVVLIISFIPLMILIFITIGILSFWKITYMETSFKVLGISIYNKYTVDQKIPNKQLIGGIIVIILLIISGVGTYKSNTVYQTTYKVNAYNGQEYDFVTQGNNIVNIRFESLAGLNNGPIGIEKDIILDGKTSNIVAVFNTEGMFLGISFIQNKNVDLGDVTMKEILKGAKSYSTGVGFSVG